MDRYPYPVWRGPILVIVVVIGCFGWWWWKCPCPTDCDYPVYREVVVDEECVAHPEDVDVNPDELVIWTNLTPDTLTIEFDASSPFLVDHFWIPPGHQLTFKVKSDAPAGNYDYDRGLIHADGSTESCEGAAGGPTVKVGGGGP